MIGINTPTRELSLASFQFDMWWGFGVVLVWAAALAPVDAATAKSDVSALGMLFTSLNSPSQLTNWNSSGGDPCGQSWKGVTCSGSNVTEVKLSGLGLSGHLGFALDRMTSLTIFDLSNNNIGAGNPLPYALPPNITRLDFSRNAFGGNLPYSISLMTNLKYLNISHNQLQDGLSDMFRNLPKLSEMDLSFNNHSGNLPQSFSALSNLTTLYLQDNNFTGSLNVLANLPLQNLNVANNRFTGGIPDQLKGIKYLESSGNSWNSESGLPSPTSSHPSPTSSHPSPTSSHSSRGGRKANPSQSPVGNSSPSDEGGGSKFGIGGAGIAGIVVSALVAGSLVAVALFFIKSRKRKPTPEKLYKDNQLMPTGPSYENNDTMSFQMPSAVVLPVTTNLKPPPVDRTKSFGDGDYLSITPSAKNSRAPTSATFYSVADLQVATRSFSMDNLLGEGTYGQVYKAQFDDGKVLAVKKINSSSLPENASEAFMEIVSSISRLQHQNLTNLVGYCSEHGQHLLVYEFHKNGSLHDFLHISDEYSKPLSWNGRIMIALGTARGLEYLHEVCSPSIMHKNFKSANILLDAELNPHISDSGLSDIVSDAEYQVFNLDIGSGYSAPEVVMTGQYTLKSDVYSFGIIMLELLTGRTPFDSSKPRNEQSLVRWATPQLHDIDALDKMVDPALKGLYPAKSLSRFADIVALCIQPEPEFRPPMSEVVQALVRLVQRANMSKKMGSIDEYEASQHSEDPSLNDIIDDALGPR